MKFKAYLFSLIPYFRNRLRCPRCHAIGTYKPHGTIFDTKDLRCVPRWLCKWCGLYHGPEGRNLQCRLPNPAEAGEIGWQLDRTGETADTPEQRCNGAFPWRG